MLIREIYDEFYSNLDQNNGQIDLKEIKRVMDAFQIASLQGFFTSSLKAIIDYLKKSSIKVKSANSEIIYDFYDLSIFLNKIDSGFVLDEYQETLGFKTSEKKISKNKQFYSFLGEVITSYIPDESKNNWNSATLFVQLQPGTVSLNGHFFEGDEKKWLSPSIGYEKSDKILKFHNETTKDESLRWNKLVINLSNQGAFEVEYIWDVKYQKEVDSHNLEFEKNNSNYQRPKWPWEK
ncbi:hypothetical protein R3X28_19175 [Maribacter sp. TH_r10]|uniref:hypothetical protein n=1 Tax=Maribacter sp. TH_r10 TaxID=3082086 RepID=UPI002954E16C|nr:hypothetical protein [Maribacter sp. TH_r10]MDV7141013.1 hypothetical protein [Maribacter sp. TH_r10]